MTELENFASSVQNEVARSREENAENAEISAKVLDAYEVAKFWSRVEVRKRNHCWPWRYDSTKDGYGDFRLSDGNSIQAHRVAYLIGAGNLPRGLVVRHICDNTLCCNPKHLVIGSHADNVADRVARGRSARGEKSGRAVLTEALVLALRKSPLSDAYWATRCGVDKTTIAAARKGETWAHLPM